MPSENTRFINTGSGTSAGLDVFMRTPKTKLATSIIIVAFSLICAIFVAAVFMPHIFKTSEPRGTLDVRGAVIAKADDTNTAIDEINIYITNATAEEIIDLTPGTTILTYTDADQTTPLGLEDITVIGLGNAQGRLLARPGDVYQIIVRNLGNRLEPDLVAGKQFTVLIKPRKAAALHVIRQTPLALDRVNNLG